MEIIKLLLDSICYVTYAEGPEGNQPLSYCKISSVRRTGPKHQEPNQPRPASHDISPAMPDEPANSGDRISCRCTELVSPEPTDPRVVPSASLMLVSAGPVARSDK